MQRSKEEVAADLLVRYGLDLKPTDEIIPFYGMLQDLNIQMEELKKRIEVKNIVFENNGQAFFYSFGKWGLVLLIAVIISVSYFLGITWSRQRFPSDFLNNGTIVSVQLKNGQKVTGFVMTQGRGEKGIVPGKEYLFLNADGSILVPLK